MLIFGYFTFFSQNPVFGSLSLFPYPPFSFWMIVWRHLVLFSLSFGSLDPPPSLESNVHSSSSPSNSGHLCRHSDPITVYQEFSRR